METEVKNNTEEKSVAPRNTTLTNRFVEKVNKEFISAVGEASGFTDHERKLAVNFYIHADNMLQQFEAKRMDDGNNNVTPYTWENVNMAKLAVEAVHRIRIGLDALIPNHLHLIPYYNKRTGKYDMDVRIGYEGRLYMAKEYSVQPIKDIRVHLVHKNDEFTLMEITGDNPSENFRFQRATFDRGEVVGGFAFIRYEDESLNKVVTCDANYFNKIKGTSKTNAFWGKWGDEMKKKTVSLRAFDEVDIDPTKTSKSFHEVQRADNPYIESKKEVVDVDIKSDGSEFDEDGVIIEDDLGSNTVGTLPEGFRADKTALEVTSTKNVSPELVQTSEGAFQVDMSNLDDPDEELPF